METAQSCSEAIYLEMFDLFAEMATAISYSRGLPEFIQKINSKIVAIKIRQRKSLGWDKVHDILLNLPFCEKNQQIAKMCLCQRRKKKCKMHYACILCNEKGNKHIFSYIINPIRSPKMCKILHSKTTESRIYFNDEYCHRWVWEG